MTTKIPKTSSKGAKKKLTDNELPEERITLKTVLDAVVNIHSRLNRMEFQAKEIAAKLADPPPAKEWVPKVNEVMGCCNNNYAYICDEIRANGYIEVSNNGGSLGRNIYWPGTFKKATGNEITYKACVEIVNERIAEHKRKEDLAKITELQEGDAVECIPSTQHKLMELARLGGVPKLDDEKAPNLRWENWSTSRGSMLIETVDPEDYSKKAKPLNWLPFDEFKRRLLGTIARLKTEALYTLLDAQAAELKMTREIKAEAEAKAEEERLAKEAAAKAEADRIAAAQAEIERKEKEMAEKERKMNDRINEVRKAELIAAGMTLDDPDDGLPFGPSLVLVDMCLPVHALHSMTDEQYTEAIAEAKRQKAELDEYNRQREEEARVQRERQEQERIAREEQLKAEAAQRAIAEERERVEREREAKEREEALRAQQEADRIASMGDKELVEQLSLYLVSAPIPELHTAIGKHGMERVRKHLDELIKMVNAIAKDL